MDDQRVDRTSGGSMSAENEIKSFLKYRKHSAQHIPVGIGFFVVLTPVAWLLFRYLPGPSWLAFIPIAVCVFSIISDVINYFYCGHKLRQLGHHPIEEI